MEDWRSQDLLNGRVTEVEGTVYHKDFEFQNGVIKEYKGQCRNVGIPEMIQGEWVQVLGTNWEGRIFVAS